MEMAAEASIVGRVVKIFLELEPRGFRGKMSVLLDKLNTYRGQKVGRDWPVDATSVEPDMWAVGSYWHHLHD